MHRVARTHLPPVVQHKNLNHGQPPNADDFRYIHIEFFSYNREMM